MKASNLAMEGKFRQAKDVCLEILKLYKKYHEENLEMLFPLLVLYYKLGNYDEANKYLTRINKANPHFLKFFKGTMKINKDIEHGYYQHGDSSEVFMCLNNFAFLLSSVPALHEYILENSKKTKK